MINKFISLRFLCTTFASTIKCLFYPRVRDHWSRERSITINLIEMLPSSDICSGPMRRLYIEQYQREIGFNEPLQLQYQILDQTVTDMYR